MSPLTVDLALGVDSTALKKGSVAIPKKKPKASTDSLPAAGTLNPTAAEHRVQGTPGAVTLSAVTAIGDGQEDGERLSLKGTSNTNTVTILDGANTKLNGAMILGQYDYLELEWDGSDWNEVARSN